MVICLERSANDLHMVWLMPLPSRRLCFSKIQNGLSFWYRPTQVVLEKRPLNDCLCVCLKLLDGCIARAKTCLSYVQPFRFMVSSSVFSTLYCGKHGWLKTRPVNENVKVVL